MNWIVIFLGGGFGSIVRYGLGILWRQNPASFPFSTLLANLSACIVIGILLALPIKQNNHLLWLLMATGFCGGLSTFSTFSMETVALFREGNTIMAWLNIALSLILCLLSVWFISKSGINPSV